MLHDPISIFSLDGHESFSRSAEEIHHVSFHRARSYPEGRGCEAGKYRSFDRRTHDMIPTSDFGVQVRTIARMDSPFDRQIYEWSVLVVTAGASCFDAYILTFSPFAIFCIPSKTTLIHQRYAMDSTKMQYRFLGNTGTKVSVISLGGWLTHGGHTGNEVAKQTMKAAYEAGVNFFDSVSGLCQTGR